MEISPSEAYSMKTLKQKLFMRYKNKIIVSIVIGKGNVVTLTNQASNMIKDKWYENRHVIVKD